MKMTVQNISNLILSTDIGNLEPGEILINDYSPEEAYGVGMSLKRFVDYGYLTVTTEEGDTSLASTSGSGGGLKVIASGGWDSSMWEPIAPVNCTITDGSDTRANFGTVYWVNVELTVPPPADPVIVATSSEYVVDYFNGGLTPATYNNPFLGDVREVRWQRATDTIWHFYMLRARYNGVTHETPIQWEDNMSFTFKILG